MAHSHLLDTSVFCQPVKDVPNPFVLERWSALGDARVCTSAICLAEVLQGLEARHSQKYWRRFNALLHNRYAALPFDAAAASEFGTLASILRHRGEPKPVIDLLIAATAKRHGLIVATLNVRHFSGIPDVVVEDWSHA